MEEKKPESLIDVSKIKELLNVLHSKAEEERLKSDSYKDLFYNHGDRIDGLLRKCEHGMMEVILDTATVLEKKYGVKVTNEAYMILLGLPLMVNQLEKNIQNDDGFVCCVDKVYYILSKFIVSELKNLKEGGCGG